MRVVAAFLTLLPALALAQFDGGIEARERCARRIASALTDQGPSPALMAASDPQSMIPQLLGPAVVPTDGGMIVYTPFQEKFSRYIDKTFNSEPGMVPAEDAAYYLTRHVLQNNLAWSQLYIGPYRVDPGPTVFDDARVVNDTAGLGYFRSRTWMVRYAGNEIDGYRLVTAYRMMNNVLGVKLTAAQNTDGINSTSRQSNAACSGCHYEPVFGLDLAAKILSRRSGTGTTMTFIAPNEGPQLLLGGQTISNDSQFVTAMVNAADFKFRACRIAFEFLYGRPEYKCEGQIFDRCMTAFTASGRIQDAISTVSRDPSFCQ
jgi:hypothetical protein